MARGHYATWSGEELVLLLHAWAEQSARVPALRNLNSAVFQHFLALSNDCGVAQQASRVETAAIFKMNTMRNMHAIICVFLATADAKTQSENVRALHCESNGDEDGTLDAWLAMPEHKRRRYFAQVNIKSYPYTEISQEAFDTIHKILTKDGARAFVLPQAYRDQISAFQSTGEAEEATAASVGSRNVRREKKATIEPTLSIRDAIPVIENASEQFSAAMARFKAKKKTCDTTETREEDEPVNEDDKEDLAMRLPPEDNNSVARDTEGNTVIVALAPTPESSDLAAQDSGSDTESEDEWDGIVPRSPVREKDSVTLTNAKQKSTTLGQELDGDALAHTENEMLKRSLSPTEQVYPEKRLRGMQQEVSMVMEALEQQTFALKDVLRKAKGAWKRDQLERKQIFKHLRQEHDARYNVLEILKRQEEEIRRQRAEWRREQDEMRLEWNELS